MALLLSGERPSTAAVSLNPFRLRRYLGWQSPRVPTHAGRRSTISSSLDADRLDDLGINRGGSVRRHGVPSPPRRAASSTERRAAQRLRLAQSVRVVPISGAGLPAGSGFPDMTAGSMDPALLFSRSSVRRYTVGPEPAAAVEAPRGAARKVDVAALRPRSRARSAAPADQAAAMPFAAGSRDGRSCRAGKAWTPPSQATLTKPTSRSAVKRAHMHEAACRAPRPRIRDQRRTPGGQPERRQLAHPSERDRSSSRITAGLAKPSPKPLSDTGIPMPSSGVLNTTKIAVLPSHSCLISASSITTSATHPLRQAAHEGDAAHIGAVHIEPEAVGQQHAQRRQHPQQPGLPIGGFQHDHRQPDIGLILGRHVLDDGALLEAGARRRVAAHLPVAILGLHHALGERPGGAGQAGQGPRSGPPVARVNIPDITCRFLSCHRPAGQLALVLVNCRLAPAGNRKAA